MHAHFKSERFVDRKWDTIYAKKYDTVKKKDPRNFLSFYDNLTYDYSNIYIPIWSLDFEYSMGFIMYINKYSTIWALFT